MDPITVATLASGPGAWFVTTGILITLKDRLGPYWNDLANRLTSIFLPIVLVEVGLIATASIAGDAIPWWMYIIGALNGLLAATGTASSQSGYDKRVIARQMKKAAG